jgi:AAA ATPase domain
LQQISTLWQRAKNGKGQVALVCGEAGIGKSRVCEEWLGCIANESHIVIRFQCSPHHTSSPFYPVIRQLENAARFEREDTPHVKLTKLAAMLSRAFLVEAERHKDTAALCVAHRALGTTYVTTGEFAAGLRDLKRARALYDSQHHPRYRSQYGQDIGAAALCYLSWALWHLGYVDQASTVAAER